MRRVQKWMDETLPVKTFSFLMLVSSAVYAVPDRPPGMPGGGCWADPMNNLIVVLSSSSFYSNQEGTVATMNFMTQPSTYPGWCYSEDADFKAARYFGLESGLVIPGKTEKYYQMSDDVDVRVGVNFSDGYAEAYPPMWDRYYPATAGATRPGVSELVGARVGNSGSVTFKLRRTLIGGAFFVPGGLELARMYRYVYAGKHPTIPLYRLITQQTLIPVPVVCGINGGKTIDIDFGLIDSDRLTQSALSSPYHEQQHLQYKCNTSLTQDMRVDLVAEPAAFSDAIKTTNPDVGVVMLYNNVPVKPYGSFKTKVVNGMGSDDVSFAIVGNGKKPATGDFTGSAVLIIASL